MRSTTHALAFKRVRKTLTFKVLFIISTFFVFMLVSLKTLLQAIIIKNGKKYTA